MSDLEAKVSAVCDDLVAQGRKVTIDAVRTAVGGGSLRDITPAVRKWRDHKASGSKAAVVVPQDVQDMFGRAGGQIWSECQRYAQQDIEAIRVQAAEQVSNAREEAEAALRELSVAESARDEARSQIEEGRTLRAEAEATAKASTAECERLRGDLSDERQRGIDALSRAERAEGALAIAAESLKKLELIEQGLRQQLQMGFAPVFTDG